MNELYIGLLSGTSMDAIDCALVRFEEDKPQLSETINFPIPNEFRQQCLKIVEDGQGSIDDYGHLDVCAGELFADAVLALLKKTALSPKQIRAIGSHGQTIRHRPLAKPPFSLQIGDPNIIAERTGIPTIADFRRRDLAAGGLGAPLAPAFHQAIFSSQNENRVVINIGGIANLSILPKKTNEPVLGFDSGPGNCLMDAFVKESWQLPFDEEGKIAASGIVQEQLLNLCLQDPYFHLKAPKSTGREYFNLHWLKEKIKLFKNDFLPQDIQASLATLTARSIANAIQNSTVTEAKIFVSGGGAQNTHLLNTLSQELNCLINTTDALGFAPDWIEALLFAWLAKQTLEGKAGNCPSVTGARRAIPLGGIFGLNSGAY